MFHGKTCIQKPMIVVFVNKDTDNRTQDTDS